MSFSPLVTVIIPCYNYGRFLAECLNSILNQTYQNWECIIVNDGSTDNSEEVALQYEKSDKRFVYLKQSNSGQWASRNLALKHAKGKYIQYLDADDMLQPDKLLMQVPILEENSHIDVVYSDILKFDDNGQQERDFELYHQPDEFPKTGKGEDIINLLLTDNFFLPGCVIMRKNVFDKLDVPFKKAYGLEDWDLWMRMAAIGCEFYHDSREGTRLLTRFHGSNVSSKHKRMLEDRLNVRPVILADFIKMHKQGKLNLSPSYISKVIREHKIFNAREKATYHLYYKNILKGILNVIVHAYYSRKPYFAIYDGAHYLKERVKRNK